MTKTCQDICRYVTRKLVKQINDDEIWIGVVTYNIKHVKIKQIFYSKLHD